MRQLPALDTPSNVTKFWRSYVFIGVLTYSMGATAVLAYSLATSGPHRGVMVALSGLSLLASIGPFRLLGLRLVETRWSTLFFTSWAAFTFVFIAVGAVLNGGVRSPISYFLILPMLFAGLAYSAGTVTFLATFGVVTSLAVGLLTPDRSWSTTAFLAVGIVIAGVITVAAAAQRDRLMRQLMAAASVDALTGCLNRGAFQERLVHESMLAQRHGGTFSLVVTDLDNLKALNDANGHHCGDRALRLLAGVLRQAARETDVVGRLGGDEFALLLHGTDQDAAVAMATRLRDSLHDVTGPDWVTASIGISTWSGPNDGPDVLLRRADEALYVAKRSGRDRAALWEPAATEAQAGLQWLGRRPRHPAVRNETPAQAVG
jgi:diguanylate cyclase (GGDEF)-like protein